MLRYVDYTFNDIILLVYLNKAFLEGVCLLLNFRINNLIN